MTGSSGHRRVPIEFYKNLEINLPTLKNQEKIVSKVKNIEREIEILKEKQINLNEDINKIVEKYIK